MKRGSMVLWRAPRRLLSWWRSTLLKLRLRWQLLLHRWSVRLVRYYIQANPELRMTWQRILAAKVLGRGRAADECGAQAVAAQMMVELFGVDMWADDSFVRMMKRLSR